MKGVLRTAFQRIRLMARQGQLKATDDRGPLQRVDLKLTGDESAGKAVRAQQYGISTNVRSDSGHAIVLTVNGHKIVIALDEPDRRPRGLQEGEVCLYTREDVESDEGQETIDGQQFKKREGTHHRIHFKNGRIIAHQCGEFCTIEQSPDHIHLKQADGDVTELFMDKNKLILRAGYSEIYMDDSMIRLTAHAIDERWSKD